MTMWNDYAALQRAVDRVEDGLTDALLHLDRVSRSMPLETFPERRLAKLQDKVADLSASLHRALKDVARRRIDHDEAAARVDALCVGAVRPAAEVMAEAKRETV